MDTIPDALPPDQYVIYALVDPTDEMVYYVGQSRNPKRRLEQHLSERHHQSEKGRWLRHLRQQGQQPLMKILETVQSEEAALEQEKKWIYHFLEGKMPLLNREAQPAQKRAERTTMLVAEVRRIQTSISGAPPIVGVKLPNGQVGATLHSLCLALSLSVSGQLKRLHRQSLLSAYLVKILLETTSGLQEVDVLLTSAIPFWTDGIQMSHLDAARYANLSIIQQEVVPALYRAFSNVPPLAEESIASESLPQSDQETWMEARLAALEAKIHDLAEEVTSLSNRTRAYEQLLAATIKRLLELQHYVMQFRIQQGEKLPGRRRGRPRRDGEKKQE